MALLIYYLMLILVVVPGLFLALKFPENKLAKIAYLTLVGLALVFISGWRFGIGFDYYAYLTVFEQAKSLTIPELFTQSMEPGFMLFVKFTALFGSGQMLYIMATILMVGLALATYSAHSAMPFVSVLYYIVIGHFYSGMNLLRYTIAGMIVLAAFPFLVKTTFDYTKANMKKEVLLPNLWQGFLPYLAVILLAASFHKSALMMIPFYFLVKIPLNRYTAAGYTVIAVLGFFLAWPAVRLLSDLFFNGNYSHRSILTNPGGSYHVMFPAFVLLVALLLHKRLIERKASNLILINLTIFSTIFYLLAAFQVFIFTRVAFYPSVFETLLVAEIVACLFTTKETFAQRDALEAEIKTLDNEEEKAMIREKTLLLRKLKATIKDERSYAAFGLFLAITMGFIFQYRLVGNGSHAVFPYMAKNPAITNWSNGLGKDDREKKANFLKMQTNIGQYLKAANDDQYVVFVAVRGDIGASGLTAPYFEGLTYFGLDARLAGQNGLSYVAVGEKDNPLLQKMEAGLLKETVTVAGVQTQIISAAGAFGETSAIVIGGQDYAINKPGINVVVYDKVLGKVVDSVNFNVSYGDFRERADTKGLLIRRQNA